MGVIVVVWCGSGGVREVGWCGKGMMYCMYGMGGVVVNEIMTGYRV